MSSKVNFYSFNHDIKPGTLCGICLEDLNDGKTVVAHRSRHIHPFHKECIKNWIRPSLTKTGTSLCPTCFEPINLSSLELEKIKLEPSRISKLPGICSETLKYLIYLIGLVTGFSYRWSAPERMFLMSLIFSKIIFSYASARSTFIKKIIDQMIKNPLHPEISTKGKCLNCVKVQKQAEDREENSGKDRKPTTEYFRIGILAGMIARIAQPYLNSPSLDLLAKLI